MSSRLGLTREEAARRLATDGPNELRRTPRAVPLRAFVDLVANPLTITLLLASGVSAIAGEVVNALVIVAMVLLGLLLSYWQTHRAHRAAERLRAMVTPLAEVERDGRWSAVPHREVVRGDAVRVNAGDLVPADARLIDERELHVQEAALSGESLPIEKSVGDTIFQGTAVVSGTAVAIVERAGDSTELGRIVAHLAERPPATEFERGTREYGFFIMRAVLFLVLFVMLVNVMLHRDPLESLLFAVALAVGLTPEYLPMIMSVTLAHGAMRMSRRGVIVKSLGAMQNLGSIDILCSDKTNTLTTGRVTLERSIDATGGDSEAVVSLAGLNAGLQTGIASPLDEAILARVRVDSSAVTKLDEIPFDFARRRLSVVIETEGGPLIITKGAPEYVVPACIAYATSGGEFPLDERDRAQVDATYTSLSREGYRVLAVASRRAARQTAYRTADERALTLAGFLAFADPPIEGIGATLARLRDDGVELKVLSGDDALVAGHVCRTIGMTFDRVVIGDEIDRIDDRALGSLAEASSVFARVTPEQKERILLALKRRGHVVGFLGDGVNDAPSLQTADIGISVEGGVDAAKDAADVILQGRGLAVLHEGIVAGRESFGNVVKYLLMGTSSSFGNMLSMAAASMFLPFLPMLPRQILLNDLLYDVAQVAIPTDAVDPAFVRKPRRWDIRLIRNFMLVLGPVSSAYDLLTFGALLFVFHADAALFRTGWFVESLATQTLVLFVIRSADRPWHSRPSAPLAVTTLAALAVGVVLPFSPLAQALGFVPLPAPYLAFVAVVVIAYLAVVELLKGALLRSSQPAPR